MSHFSGIGETELFERGTYLEPDGNFRLSVRKLLVKTTRKSGDGFIVEFNVVESDHPSHKVGSRVTWFQMLRDKDVAMPAIKEFMVSLLQVDMSDPEAREEFNDSLEAVLEEATGFNGKDEDHPLFGQEIDCRTYNKETKRGSDFTVHQWSPAS